MKTEEKYRIDFDITKIPSPAYVIDERLLLNNLKILKEVQERADCHILLAQKAFSMYETYEMMTPYLCGTTASSLNEAKLGAKYFEGEVHIFAPAYRQDEIDEILELCDHIVFNSLNQWKRYKEKVLKVKQKKHLECGLRINPEYSEIEVDLYNPCFPNSRFGILEKELSEDDLEGIDGFHFHTMCEQNSDVLARTLPIVEKKFGKYFKFLKWINFGGGHHITKQDYKIDLLIQTIQNFRQRYELEVYLEPGEAIALDTGYLVSEVLEIMEREMNLAIMDTSAACHMPDVLEMPYRPYIIGSFDPKQIKEEEKEKYKTYRLGGPTCLSGDVIGEYAFLRPLEVGERLIFTDMAIYTMVKNNTFNGMNLPAIVRYTLDKELKVIKTFRYQDFEARL